MDYLKDGRLDNRSLFIDSEAFPQEKLYFHHTVATGGNSFAMAISKSYPGYEIFQITGSFLNDNNVDFFDKEGRILFYGHNLFNLPEKAGYNPRYITLLRHPFDRLLSDYFWINLPNRQPYDVFREFCCWVKSVPYLEFYIFHYGLLGYRNSQHFNLADYQGIDMSSSEQETKYNLDNKFQLVGITELFDESLFILGHKVGLQAIAPWWLTRHPKSPYRPSFFDLPLDVRRIIENKCQKDIELYDFYRNKLENELVNYDFNESFFKYKNAALRS